jgi:hypothetical protein
VGLWKCHNEKYDQFIDQESGRLILPRDVLLYDFNCLVVPDKSLLSVTEDNDSNTLYCSNCRQIVGTFEQSEARLFIEHLLDLNSDKFEKTLIDALHEHFFIDKVHDLLFVCCGNEDSVKIKPMSVVKTCKSPDLVLSTTSLKVVYNQIKTNTVGQ